MKTVINFSPKHKAHTRNGGIYSIIWLIHEFDFNLVYSKFSGYHSALALPAHIDTVRSVTYLATRLRMKAVHYH